MSVWRCQSPRQTLAAQLRWGWRPMLHYLSWRRFGMARALYLPIDLLEGGPRPGERRRVIGGSVRGIAVLLTLACSHFALALLLAAYARWDELDSRQKGSSG